MHPFSSFGPMTAAALLILATPAAKSQDPEPVPSSEESEAEPRSTHAEVIVVTAERRETPVRTVGSSVTVLDRAEIERRNQTTVLELLRTVPGLEVSQGGGPGKTASVFLRGGSSSHTLVLLDGVRVNDATTGAFDFADLTTDQIERIEIVRGPQGLLYGSEAVAGVISIASRRGREGLRGSAEVGAGSHDLRHLRLALDGGTGRLDYSLAVADLATDGVSAASERRGNRERDPYDNRTAAGRLGLAFLGDGRVDLSLRHLEGDTRLDGFDFIAGPVDDPDFTMAREALSLALKVEKDLARRWRQSFLVGHYDEDLAGADPTDPFNNFAIGTRRTEITAQSDLALSPADTLSLGYTLERRQGENLGAFAEVVHLRSAFAHNRWSWRERLFLTAGVRRDDHSRFGGETTFRVTGARLWPGSGTRLHASYGTGFRAPSLNELFFPGFGNPGLAPETSEGLDLGVEQTFLGGRLRLDATYFETDFDDLIGFDFTTFRAANIARAEVAGLEVEARLQAAPGLAVDVSHTYTETEDLATGRALARRPRNRSALALGFEASARLSGALTGIAVADRVDSDGSTMDDYQRLDLSLAYRATRLLAPYLRLENLLDQEYEEITGFTSPGLTAAVGLKVGL